jgi:hypothetical protein
MPQISGSVWIDCRSALAREKYQPVTSPSLTHRVRQHAGSLDRRYKHFARLIKRPKIKRSAGNVNPKSQGLFAEYE